MTAALAISGAAGTATQDNSKRPTPPRCTHARQHALPFYTQRISHWHRLLGRNRAVAAGQGSLTCLQARTQAVRLRERAHTLRLEWVESRTLREQPTWLQAVEEAQRAYPGTASWLRSCSASEGGWGRWVPNRQGSGASGWLQFMSGTFWRMYGAARADVQARGYLIPASSASWYSPLGQALAGAWGVTNGRRHEWVGGGC